MSDKPRTPAELSKARFAAVTASARRSQRLGVGIVIGLAVFVAVVSSVVSAWNTAELRQLTRDTRELLRNELPIAAAVEVEKRIRGREREFGVASVRCLIEQLSEHRHLNDRAHRDAAAAHGYSLPVSPDQEPPPVSEGASVCEPFLRADEEER